MSRDRLYKVLNTVQLVHLPVLRTISTGVPRSIAAEAAATGTEPPLKRASISMRVIVVPIHREHALGPTGKWTSRQGCLNVGNLRHELMFEPIDGIIVRIESHIGCAISDVQWM